MFRSTKLILLYFIVLLFAAGCTKLSPELGFGKLSGTEDSFTIESTALIINSKNVNSKIVLSGKCEINTNILLTVNDSFQFVCENYAFSKELTSADFTDGETIVKVDALDDSKNKIATRSLKIIKDTSIPTATISGPASVSVGVNSILLYGSCSEDDLDVVIHESNSGNKVSAKCSNKIWDYTYDITNYTNLTEFKFYAVHSDLALNDHTTSVLTVNRFILGTFNIDGVADVAAGGGYGNLLKNSTATISISWDVSAGASTYDLKLERIVPASPATTLCAFLGIGTTAKTINLASECTMGPGQEIRITVTAWDSTHVYSIASAYTFNTKAPARLRNDSRTLYINSRFTGGVSATNISFNTIIEDPNSTGPFNVAFTNTAGLNTQIAVDNSAAGQKIVVSPAIGLAATSGVFNTTLKITDENGIMSDPIALKIIVVFPYSWAGLVDNDFNNKSNWCGVADLKQGCSGQSAVVDGDSRIVIDELCMIPTPEAVSINCSPTLSANTVVKTFHMRAKHFFQNAHSLVVGSASDSEATFQMTGGDFNDDTSSGDLTFYKTFYVGGGTFTAPYGSNVFINTKMSANGSRSFEVTDKNYYVHNESTLHLVDADGKGESMSQIIQTPINFLLKNLTVNSNGGHWKISSENLILQGDLNLIGTEDSSGNRPRLNALNGSSKIQLKGNLNCEGAFQGGTLPIYIKSAVSYKSIYAGCKFPPIVLNDTEANLTKDASSTEDIVMQGLTINSGTFSAPSTLIFRTYGLDGGSTVVNTLNGFIPNSGTVIFESAENNKNYKVKPGSYNNLAFSNPNSFSGFYDLENDLTVSNLSFSGANAVPLRGSGRTISASALNFESGLVNDNSRLSKIILKSGGSGGILQVSTTSKINLPYLELQRSATLNGSSLFDFSGTVFQLGVFNLTVPALTTLNYLSKTGTGNIIGTGNINSGL